MEMSRSSFQDRLRTENLAFGGTRGVSAEAVKVRFAPAFMDLETGRVEIACYACGTPAPLHVIAGVPDEWVTERNTAGEVLAVKASIVAGFVRENRFYTREEAANAA
jgi:hypothetical protein